jgi:hypothetical protein
VYLLCQRHSKLFWGRLWHFSLCHAGSRADNRLDVRSLALSGASLFLSASLTAGVITLVRHVSPSGAQSLVDSLSGISASAGDVAWKEGAEPAPAVDEITTEITGTAVGRGSLRPQAARHYLLRLLSGPFPDDVHPQALLHLPPAFDPWADPDGKVNLVVFLHGWSNCVATVAGEDDSICDPDVDADQGPRPAFGLMSALDESQRNAALVVLQLAWDAQTGDDGTLAEDGGFRRVIAEVLADLPPPEGPRTLDDLGQVLVVAHSGAFVAAADILDRGGLDDHVRGMYLLDSLYAREDSFLGWLSRHSADGTPFAPRFVDVFVPGLGTDGPSWDLAWQVRSALRGAGAPEPIIDGASDQPVSDAALAHAVVFKALDADHDHLPRILFPQILAASDLPVGGAVDEAPAARSAQ